MTHPGQHQALRTILQSQAATQACTSDHLISAVSTISLPPQVDKGGLWCLDV